MPGTPCSTVHTYGRGKAYYVGTDPEQAFIDELSGRICQDLGLRAPLEVPEGVECTRRDTGERSFYFLINHRSDAVMIRLPRAFSNSFTGEILQGEQQLTAGTPGSWKNNNFLLLVSLKT